MSSGQESPLTDQPLALFQERFGIDDRSLETRPGLGPRAAGRLRRSVLRSTASRTRSSLEEGIVKSGDRHLAPGRRRARAARESGRAMPTPTRSASRAWPWPPTPPAPSRRARAPGAPSPCTRAAPSATSTRWPTAPTDVPVEAKVALLGEIDAYVRARDPRIVQVMASVVSQHRHVMIAGKRRRAWSRTSSPWSASTSR